MTQTEIICRQLEEPTEYFGEQSGFSALPTPTRPLLFARQSKQTLQQEALENRLHHRFVLIFNLQTAGTVHADNLTLAFAPGEAILVHPYQFHHFSRLQKSSLLWLFCTFELKPAEWLRALRNRPVQISTETAIARQELLTLWNDPSAHSDGRLQAALLRLLLELKKDQKNTSPQPAVSSPSSLIQTVNNLLSEQSGMSVTTIEELAGKLHCSESRLRSRFRENAGIPLGSYIRNYRLTRSMELLRNSDLPIADVAAEAGFSSVQAFCRLFKQKIGITPLHYRREP